MLLQLLADSEVGFFGAGFLLNPDEFNSLWLFKFSITQHQLMTTKHVAHGLHRIFILLVLDTYIFSVNTDAGRLSSICVCFDSVLIRHGG